MGRKQSPRPAHLDQLVVPHGDRHARLPCVVLDLDAGARLRPDLVDHRPPQPQHGPDLVLVNQEARRGGLGGPAAAVGLLVAADAVEDEEEGLLCGGVGAAGPGGAGRGRGRRGGLAGGGGQREAERGICAGTSCTAAALCPPVPPLPAASATATLLTCRPTPHG